jgi:hypothetical protein
MDVAEIAENSEVAEVGEGEKGMEGITPPLPTPPSSSSAEVGEKGEEGRDEAAFAAMLEGPTDGPTSTSTSATAASTSTSTTAAGGEGASPMIVSTPTEEKEEGEKEGRVSVRGLLRVLLSQCQRSHRDYRRSALLCLSTLALAFPEVQDMLALSEATLRGFARIGEGGEEEEGVDQVARARAVEALGAVFPLIPATNHEVRSEI